MTGQDGDVLAERVFDLLIEQGCVPFGTRISNFTDEDVAAGKLREAAQQADEENRAFCRRVVAAVAPDIAAQARRECADELRALAVPGPELNEDDCNLIRWAADKLTSSDPA